MDTLFVNHGFGKNVNVKLGRYANNFGNQGGWLYGDSNNFDGAEISCSNGKLWLATGFGQFNASDYEKLKNDDAYYARGAYDFGFAKLGADYLVFKEQRNDNELIGANLTIPAGEFRVFGEYRKNSACKTGDDSAGNARIGCGK